MENVSCLSRSTAPSPAICRGRSTGHNPAIRTWPSGSGCRCAHAGLRTTKRRLAIRSTMRRQRPRIPRIPAASRWRYSNRPRGALATRDLSRTSGEPSGSPVLRSVSFKGAALSCLRAGVPRIPAGRGSASALLNVTLSLKARVTSRTVGGIPLRSGRSLGRLGGAAASVVYGRGPAAALGCLLEAPAEVSTSPQALSTGGQRAPPSTIPNDFC